MTGRKPRAAFLQVGIFIPDPWAGRSLDKTKPHPNTDFHRSWNWWSHFFFFIFLIQHKFTCDKHLAVYLTFLMTKGSAAHSVCLTYPTKTSFKNGVNQRSCPVTSGQFCFYYDTPQQERECGEREQQRVSSLEVFHFLVCSTPCVRRCNHRGRRD